MTMNGHPGTSHHPRHEPRHDPTRKQGSRTGHTRAARRGAALLIAAAAAMIASPDLVAQAPSATPVRADEVRRETVEQRQRVTGELRSTNRARVAAEEPGRIIEMPVREGITVSRGDVLAKLDDTRLSIELRRLESERNVAEALIDERRATVEIRRSDLESLEQLSERGAAQPKELADARAELRAAQARLAQAEGQFDTAQADIDLLKRRISDMRITAPFDGVVIAREIDVGEWASSGEAMIEMISTGTIDAWIDVPQNTIGGLTDSASTVLLEITAADARFELSEPRIIPQVDSTARTFTTVLTIDRPDARLVPGMSVTAWVPVRGEAERLTVAKDAVMRNQAGPFVYVARRQPDGSHQATPIGIDVLFEIDGRVVVRDGALQPGDQVVVEGNERLFPMMAVRLVSDDEPLASREQRGDSSVRAP